jgi:hypothetical protein
MRTETSKRLVLRFLQMCALTRFRFLTNSQKCFQHAYTGCRVSQNINFCVLKCLTCPYEMQGIHVSREQAPTPRKGATSAFLTHVRSQQHAQNTEHASTKNTFLSHSGQMAKLSECEGKRIRRLTMRVLTKTIAEGREGVALQLVR